MKNKNFINKLQSIIIILLIIFGLFIAYQIIRKILGGSWSTENIIISLLIFNISLGFTTAISLAKLSSNHGHLKRQFDYLAKDFKVHLSIK